MKTIRHTLGAATILALTGVPAALTSQAAAQTGHVYKAGDLEIRQPWTRATPKGAPVAGGYVTITNKGKSADRLTGGSFALAGMVQIHEMKVTGGVMTMRQLEGGLEIKPGATIRFKPGGLHLMFMRLKAGVSAGKPIKGSLIFEKAGEVKVEFAVGRLGSKTPPPGHHKH